MKNFDSYLKFVNGNTGRIADYVNEFFVKDRHRIKSTVLAKLQSYVSPAPEHYVYKHSGVSGSLYLNGFVSLEQTVMHFLEEEYTGTVIPDEHCDDGRYQKYCDVFEDFATGLAGEVVMSAVRDFMEQYFEVELSDEVIEALYDACSGFNDIYEESVAYNFGCYDYVLEFAELRQIKLSELERIVVVSEFLCYNISQWKEGTAQYTIGQAVSDETFFYASVVESDERFRGTYAYEYDHKPAESEVEEEHLNKLSALDIDMHEG